MCVHFGLADTVLTREQVLAALDVHTARWIIDKCFKGDLVHGRTVILVVSNIHLQFFVLCC